MTQKVMQKRLPPMLTPNSALDGDIEYVIKKR